MTAPGHVTRLLQRAGEGEVAARDELFSIVYDELHSLAATHLRGERRDHSLGATDLVHEAFLRLAGSNDVDWKSRSQFYALASTAIRNILVDHARRRNAAKRGGRRRRVPLHEADDAVTQRDHIDFVALSDALDRLAALDERQSRVVELRFFGGLDVSHAARVLEVSERTIERDWSLARAWLARELQESDPG